MKCSSFRRVHRRHRRNAYENHNGDFRSEAAGGSIHVRSVLPPAGCPCDTAETLTKNTTGTSGPKRPLDPCSTYSLSRPGPRRHSGTAYENHNGDFRSEAAVGFVFDVFSLSAVSRRENGNTYEKHNRDFRSEVAVGSVFEVISLSP